MCITVCSSNSLQSVPGTAFDLITTLIHICNSCQCNKLQSAHMNKCIRSPPGNNMKLGKKTHKIARAGGIYICILSIYMYIIYVCVYLWVCYVVSLPKKPHLNEQQSNGKWRGQGGQWD